MFRWCICILICFPLLAYAQAGEEKCRWLKTDEKEQLLDSLTVYPASLKLANTDSTGGLNYDPGSGMLSFSGNHWPDSVLLCFRVLPYALHNTYYKRTLHQYDSAALYEYPQKEKSQAYLKEELFATDSLHKSGSITRGISFGNRQNVFVQSALNLQLDGKLSDQINIRAAISDQNVPFQPEGNTQNLQEFDKVFIQLYNDHTSLTAGDFVMQPQGTYFLRYLKNVQGIGFNTRYPLIKEAPSETEAGLALAKGKFASVNLEPVEGLSGPYKLPGPTGQSFVMVLSNSEQVFLDGRLLKRGFNYDYVIDYNLGEITFSPGIIITRYSRIRVDYEYSDQSYTRSIFNAAHMQQLGKVRVYGRFYQEKDNRNQPLSADLSDEQKHILSLAGDNPEGVYASSADSVGYNENLLLYRQAGSVNEAGERTVFYEFSNNPSEAFYQLSFADVGEGNGNYVFKEYIGTGKVYEYLAPVNGQPSGRYEPVRVLVAPTKKNMLVSGLNWQISKYQQLSAEGALSVSDQNLYSEADAADDKGTGFKTAYRIQGLPAGFNEDFKWEGGIEYEFVEKHFTPVDRFRSVEFDREWGINPGWGNSFNETFTDQLNDHLLTLSGGLRKDESTQYQYRISGRRKGGLVNGWQQQAALAQKAGLLQLNGSHFYLHNRQPEVDIRWLRWSGTAALHFPKWVPGYRYTADRQASRAAQTDSLLSTLMNYDEHSFFLHSGKERKNDLRLEYSRREDMLPQAGEFEEASLAHTTSLSFASSEIKKHQFRSLVSHRYSTFFQDTSSAPQAENILTGQFNWLGSFWQKTIRSEVLYTLGSGRELRRDYVYVRVPVGEGTHTWRDENGNGVQELSEFYEAINPDEREFLRIFVPNTDFILAYTSELNYRLNFQGAKAWAESHGIKQLLYRLSGNLNWRVSKKATEDGLAERFLPFAGDVEDEKLLNSRQSLQLNLFYNRANPRWGLDGSLIRQERKQLLSAGFETDYRRHYSLGYRYNIGRVWGLKIRAGQGHEANLSDYLQSSQYIINIQEVSPEVSWMPGLNFQLIAGASVEAKENTLNTEQARSAQVLDIKLESRYSHQGSSTVSATVRQVQIAFDGQENSPAGYNMLEALRPGTNWVWNASLQQRLLKGLQLSITYEGRKSQDQQVVHLGRMMMQALF